MHSPLLARSPNNGRLLIAAVSGRALAAAARRAGYAPLVADFFCDTDTVALAERTAMLPGNLHDGIDVEKAIEALTRLAGDGPPVAVVLGSGFERRTELVDAIAGRFPLAGNRGAAIRRVKDPQVLAADCAALGIPHPEYGLEPPPDPENWVAKTAGAAGGTHVRRGDGGVPPLPQRSMASVAPLTVSPCGRATSPPLRRGEEPKLDLGQQPKLDTCEEFRLKSAQEKRHPHGSGSSPPRSGGEVARANPETVRGYGDAAGGSGNDAFPVRYYQRFVTGQSISALFVGDGKGARVVGFSRQWALPTAEAPFRYGGAVRLRRIERRDAAMIGGWLGGLAARAGLVGLCSADFIRNRDGWHLIEINPRPGATLDIFDSMDAPLMEAHLRASRGEAYELPRFNDSMAAMITYAARPVPRFPALAWPEWTADRQSAGTALIAGDPVCTVFARGPSAAVTRRSVEAQARALRGAWEEEPR